MVNYLHPSPSKYYPKENTMRNLLKIYPIISNAIIDSSAF